jgi:hypothetical protein
VPSFSKNQCEFKDTTKVFFNVDHHDDPVRVNGSVALQLDNNPTKAVTAMASRGPLAGVRILDLSRLLPGPYCTQLLADLGATVTKFENLDTLGDPLRHYPPLASDGNSAMFHALNRGKRSVALPFRDPSTPAKVEALLRETDVLVESFKPGTLESLLGRQDIADLLRDFPNLVVCRLSGYGQQCSDDVGGHDLNFVAAAGVLGMAKKKGSDRGKPLPVQWADLAGGAWPAALQIVAALYKRDNNSDRAMGGSATTTTISSSISSSSSSGGVEDAALHAAGRLLDVNMAVRHKFLPNLSFLASLLLACHKGYLKRYLYTTVAI